MGYLVENRKHYRSQIVGSNTLDAISKRTPMSNETKMVKQFVITTARELEDIIVKYPGTTKVTTPTGRGLSVYVYKEGKGKDAQPSIVIE